MKQKISHHIFSIVHRLEGAHFLVAAAMVANVLNFLFSTYLGRKIGFAEFGLISVIGNFLNIAQIPLSSYSRTIVHRSAYLLGKYKTPASWYWKKLRLKAIKPSLILTGLWLICIPFLAWYFHSNTLLPFLIFTPVWSIGVAAAVDSGFLSGSHAFSQIAFMLVVESSVKLLVTITIVQLGFNEYIYVAYPLAAFASFVLGWFFASHIHKKTISKHEPEEAIIPKKFFFSTVLTKLSSIAILSFDVMLAKHYLSPTEAGEYAMLSLVGNMIYFLGSLVSQFVIPFVSRDVGAGKKSGKAFTIILLFTIFTDIIGFVGIGLFGFITVPFLFGSRAVAIVPYLPIYVLAMATFSIANTIVSYYQAKDNHQYSVISLLTVASVILGISFFHQSIQQISLVMSVNAFLFLLSVIFFFKFEEKIRPVLRNMEDFLTLFTDVYKRPSGKERLSILIFNWRDTKHVWAGGAENYLHELSKQWVQQGHRVTIFCGNDQTCVRNEVVDGVQIVRRGGFYTVYFWAAIYYLLRFRGNFDIVIDSENGIPFFTPLYVKVPVFLLIHHVHQEILRKHLVFPLSHIGMFLESTIMPKVYSSSPVFTVSESSKQDILKLGFSDANRIHVVSPGISAHFFERKTKTLYPSMLYLGRLKDYKNIDTAVHAFRSLLKKHKNAKFTIAGEGSSESSLKNLVAKLNLDSVITFLGKVSDTEKAHLLAVHWVMVQPSIMEGWGMTVIEANASSTPVIASNVKGLRDSVKDKKTGLLFRPKNSADLAEKIDALFSDPIYRSKLSKSSYQWSQNFGWEECASKFINHIFVYIEEQTEKESVSNVVVYSKSL